MSRTGSDVSRKRACAVVPCVCQRGSGARKHTGQIAGAMASGDATRAHMAPGQCQGHVAGHPQGQGELQRDAQQQDPLQVNDSVFAPACVQNPLRLRSNQRIKLHLIHKLLALDGNLSFSTIKALRLIRPTRQVRRRGLLRSFNQG